MANRRGEELTETKEVASGLSVTRHLAEECGWEGDGEWRTAGFPRDAVAPT